MIHVLITAIRAIGLFTLVTGILYPVVITLVAESVFPSQARGSLVVKDGKVIGSRLLAHKVTDPKYFWYRPSASDYAALPSGASNLSPASEKFVQAVRERRAALGEGAPADLVTASGSGLDPHLSPQGVSYQLPRIIAARGLNPAQAEVLRQRIGDVVEASLRGWLGRPSIHVLDLNLMLDAL